ncbi:TonB-dependent receptor [Rhizomicrobium electricum]|uniref:TonB-dependent receptor n=1 Tax=Rhizomicrobium electricum TaxID=480070 RepID=A0ABP3P7G2_9PROT|nr:TonB-dependent receptor [Rhizomicrobium electricum]NIJ47801.1 outer membrane receptor protein involved in Fe transport [Rhizomicrobium electricum]
MVAAVWLLTTPAAAVETVVVSAAPPDPVGTAAFSTVRLGTDELRVSPQLDEALSQVPGLSLYRRNSSLSANPTTQGVSLRSIAPSAAGRALVTLDGVPQNDPFGGWVIWSALPPEDIAEAEIVRGAGAGPYGAGALTGTIALKENTGGIRASLSGGELGLRRAAAAGGADLGGVSLYASAARSASDGWIPVNTTQRGAADDNLTLDGASAAVRLQAEPVAGTLISARVSGYRENRHSGIVGTGSETSGMIASFTAAHPVHDDLGWRLQAWIHTSDFAQTSAAISTDRATATPSNHQTATPATGWGANAAVRGEGLVAWEVGADVRTAHGNAHELASYQSGAFTLGRVSGGDSVVGGLYAEGAYREGPWLATLGVRADAWSSSNGHTAQTTLATGAITTQDWPSRSGVLPTARAGLRYGDDALYVRTAAYKGFRAPSLNELYRPFRLGNNVTMANPALKPETLAGVEIGAGGAFGKFAWDLTAFANRLHAAVTNVTVGAGPGTFPGAGFVPAGGLLIQRRNAGAINAPGIEGNVTYTDGPWRLSAAFDVLDQRVHGGTEAPQLTGKRPAQAPRTTLTAAADWKLTPALTASATVRYESNRFSDDANTLRLGASAVVGARLEYAFGDGPAAYVAADNLFDARVATSSSADGILSLDAPRIVSVGLTFAR